MIPASFDCHSGQNLAGMTTQRKYHWILHGVAVQNDGVGVDEETIPTQCLLNLEAFLHTLGDSRSVAGMTAKPAQPRLAFSANLRLTFPCIPLSTSRRFLKTFYYFSYHDQIASYRASLRHGAIGLGSLHFALDAVHGAERFSSCALGYANYLQQQRRTQADACGDFAKADSAGACADCVILFKAQKGMWLQAGHRLGRFAVGSFAGHRVVREADSESRPDDDGKSQAGFAAFRCGGLLDALPR